MTARPEIETDYLVVGAGALGMGFVDTLIEQGIIEEGTTLEDAEKFIEHNVKAEDCYNTYVSLRRASGGGKKKK